MDTLVLLYATAIWFVPTELGPALVWAVRAVVRTRMYTRTDTTHAEAHSKQEATVKLRMLRIRSTYTPLVRVRVCHERY